MNSWILFFKSHKYGTFGPPFCMGISNQWSLVAACLRPTGVDAPSAPSPFPHHFIFFTSPLWPLMDLSLESWFAQLPPTLQLHVPFSFPFIPRQCQLLNQHSSQRTNYFLLLHFLSSFPAESFSFLASFPLTSHRISFSEVGDCLYNGEAWKARLSPNELGWLVFRKDYT